MSKIARLAMIAVIGLAVLGLPAALRVVGDRRARNEVERIRAANTGARVDTSKPLAPMFDAQARLQVRSQHPSVSTARRSVCGRVAPDSGALTFASAD